MGVTWHELQDTPAYVVKDYIDVMAAEAKHAERQAALAKQKSS